MPRYDANRIEAKWQRFWEENETFRTGEFDPGRQKLYVLDMFPYPSGDGLHVGHPEGYTATDIVCRQARMLGQQVLHPMGWDAFGLPAEQHAIKTGTPPRVTTEKNTSTFRRQLKMLGFSYDWSREVATTDVDYYCWTQWIFLKIYDTWYDPECEWTGPDGKTRIGRGRPIAELPIPEDVAAAGEEAVRRYQDRHRLAYQHEAPVNWCPALSTVLANEEITADGTSERGNHPVERVPLRQWMLRITAYAERLLTELDDLDWSESIKLLQRNWIGRSEGAEVDFFIGSGSGDLQTQYANWKEARSEAGFPRESGEDVLRVYTTRPDTLFGATYMVLAPEHPAVDRLTTDAQRGAVEQYRRQAALKSDLDRTDLAKEKTGVFTGASAVNPVNGEEIPIWIADYVLISYGTGAIMAVPAHDLRDWEFAIEFDLPIVPVVAPPDGYKPSKEEAALAREIDGTKRTPFAGEGTAINSGLFDGMETSRFKAAITEQLQSDGLGRGAVNYKLRDWLFSRQHFWGEPFPIWHELDEEGKLTGLVRADDPDALPVELPELEDYTPTGTPEPPLSKAPEEWLYKTAEDGTRLMRETNSMPQWAGSCWYYLRFIDPTNEAQFVDPEKERQWMPVDLYIGGAEHAVLHLLYARFWHKVLFDHGCVSTPEPFQRLVNQGMILGETMHRVLIRSQREKVDSSKLSKEERERAVPDWRETGEVSAVPYAGEQLVATSDGEFWKETLTPVSVSDVPSIELQGEGIASEAPYDIARYASDSDVQKKGEGFVLKDHPNVRTDSRAYKMSKSRGNVVNPDDIVRDYGADSLRLYEMFMGPLEATKPWSMSGVEGVARFLGRVWRMVVDDRAETVTLDPAVKNVEPTEEQLRVLHKTIKAVTEDTKRLAFNTAISRMMEFVNEIGTLDPRPKSLLEPFVLILSPYAPHIAEELWEVLGHSDTLAYEPWPEYDEALLVETTVELPVQVNGKVRGRITVPADADREAIEQAAREDEAVARNLDGKNVVKVIVVPGRLVNFVAK